MPAPDILERLGFAITEVGAAQVAVESARLFWPGGQVRVAVLVQAAWSGELSVELELRAGQGVARRSVRLGEAEVRRVRLPLELPGGAEPLQLRVRAAIAASSQRIRTPWISGGSAPEPAGSDSTFGAILGALKHAVGRREVRPEVRAPDDAAVAVQLEALGGEPPIAAEDELVWSPGMPEPEPGLSLRVHTGDRAMSTERHAQARGERRECPHCYALAYVEEVRDHNFRCPSCDHDWNPS
jgi:hypothetical protein